MPWTKLQPSNPNKKDNDAKKPAPGKQKPSQEKPQNPKTGVAGISLAAGTLAMSMAGIVALRKKKNNK